jgi:hypothetical protein
MLTTVEVRKPAGTLLTLSLEDVTNGIYLKDIQGLDPVKATIVTSSFANLDGSQLHTTKREERNIVMKVVIDPDYSTDSVRSLRRHLYSFFMPKTPVDLRFIDDDGLEVNILGRIESFESPIFTDKPQADISIICFDPDFVDQEPVETSGNTTSGSTEVLYDYVGTVETGINFKLYVDRTLTQFTIYHRPPDGIMRTLDFAANLVAGDVVEINTVPGNKYAQLNRTGTVSSLLYAVSPQSNWISLEEGNNHIRVYATGAAIPYDLNYTPRYGGL